MSSIKEAKEEREIRGLVRLFAKKGFVVRREQLARGNGFRVKSGNCVFHGQDMLFVDRRLPPSEQRRILVDSMSDNRALFTREELAEWADDGLGK